MQNKPTKKRPGRPPLQPLTEDRLRVEAGIAGGVSWRLLPPKAWAFVGASTLIDPYVGSPIIGPP